MTPAQGRRQRAALMRDIARELKAKNRAKLVELRTRVRALRYDARAAITDAIARCRAGRKLPTLKEVAAELRRAKAAARTACDVDLKAARAIKDASKRARAELAAEKKFQADIRRIESSQRRKLKESRRPGVARARARERGQESDDEVRSNIPPELVPLFEKVKRGIKGSDRRTRTEAFIEYAAESPGEEWAAIEDAADRAIAEMERRQAMPNPKKKRAKNSAPPRLTAKQSRKRFAKLKKAGCHPKRVRMGGQSVVVRDRSCKVNPRRRRARNCPNPRRPPKRWWDRCLRSVTARSHPRDPAAVCGAAWWRMPPRHREAIVRKLERGSARERRTAVAIARAERNRAEGPPRRKNGAMGDRAAAREYTRTHWGDRGRRGVASAGAANPAHGTAVKLGTLKQVEYETEKGGEAAIWVHDFEGKRPALLYNAGGLLIAGGEYVVSSHGIEG